MRTWLAALGLVLCVALLAFGRAGVRGSAVNVGEDDLRKLEQTWLDAAAGPDLPALRKMFSDDFMGTSFGAGVLRKRDVVPAGGGSAAPFSEWKLDGSTVRMFGDQSVVVGDGERQGPDKA